MIRCRLAHNARSITALVLSLGCTAFAPGAAAQEGIGDDSGDAAPAIEAAPALQTVDQVVDAIDARGVAGLREVWEQMGLGGGSLFGDLADTDSLSVSRGVGDVDGDGRDDAVLTVCDEEVSECQILILASGDAGLHALGTVDRYNQHSRTPEWRITAAESGARWFVVESMAGSGAGFDHVVATWYEPGDGGLSEVLEHSVEGHVSGHDMPFNRTFHSGSPRVSEDGSITIEVSFTATYTNGEAFEIEDLGELFVRSGTVRYRFDPDGGAFEHDDDASDWTEAELAGVFSDDEQGFLQHNVAQLKEMALAGTDPQRSWLRKFLERCESCPEKDIVQNVLDGGE